MKLKAVFIGVSLLMLLACEKLPTVSEPENLIDPETMEQILYDVTVLNAARGQSIIELKKNDVNPQNYIYRKYNIDSVQYAENTTYYSSQIELYTSMFTSVQERISREYQSSDSLWEDRERIKDSIRTREVLARRKQDSIQRAKTGDSLPTKLYKAPSDRPRFSTGKSIYNEG